MSLNMVAPVVVKPDIVSKKASVKDKSLTEKKNGSAPKSEKMIHEKLTITYPSRFPRFSLLKFLFTNQSRNPDKAVTPEPSSSGIKAESLYHIDIV